MKTVKQVSLYFKQASSDKEYHAQVVEDGGGFKVEFQFGRRGGTLQTGTKTPEPVSQAEAEKIFDKLVGSKLAKGYSPGAAGTPYVGTANEERATGLLPQLLNPVDESECERLVADPGYWMQEKYDGKRALLRKRGDEVAGVNRKGLVVGLPEPVADAAGAIPRDFVMDGELVGDVFHAFDLLRLDDGDIRGLPYSARFRRLTGLLTAHPSKAVALASNAETAGQKADMLAALKRDGREGAVFKRHDAHYVAGRPVSGGPQLKAKFHATCSAIVAQGRPGKRSVALELLDGARRVPVGNVTIPANKAVPKLGAVVELRYLYAFPKGALYQPVYLGERDDLEQSACVVAQLKYKRGEDEEA